MGDERGREFEAARMHPWSWDSVSDKTTWTPGVAELFGVSLDEFDGKLTGFLALVHDDDRASIAATIETALASGRSEFEVEHRVLPRNGRTRWLQGRGEVVRNERGAPIAIHGVVWDITARKLIELREARVRRLLAVVAAVNRESARGDSRGVLDAACRVTVEEGGFRFAWIGLREASGRVVPIASAGHAEDYLEALPVRSIGTSRVEGPTMRAIRERRPVVCNDIATDPAYALWRDMALSYGFRASAAFPFERDQIPIGALNVYAEQPGVFEEEEVQLLWRLAADIGYALEKLEREEARNRLRTSMEQNERLLALGRLARGVAHEINNPLSYVVLSFEEIERAIGSDAPNAREVQTVALARAKDGADRIRRIVRDLSAFGRGNEDEIGPVDLRAMLSSATNLSESLLKARAKLVTDFGAERAAKGNTHRLGQVAVNLLVNAADAIPEGSPDRNEIRVATFDEGDLVVFTVSDSGVSMDGATMSHAFDPFFTTKPIGEGSGLGLSIAHGIVTSMGGTIDVVSEVRRRTTFTVRLPAWTSATAPAPLEDRRPISVSRAKRSILIVDDEPHIRTSLAQALPNDDVTVAAGAFEAAKLCAARDFDCIFCDVTMHEGDGLDVLDAVIDQGRGVEARVVFMSGGAYSARTERLLASAKNPHLDKPFLFSELYAAIDRVTSKG